VRARARTLRSDAGTLVDARALPRDRFVFLFIEDARPAASHWEPLGRGFVIARLAPGARGVVRYLGALAPAYRLDPWLSLPSEALEVRRWRDGALAFELVPRSRSAVEALANQVDVLDISPHLVEESTLDTSREAANVDDVQMLNVVEGAPVYDGLTGRGVRVAVTDTGVVADHPDLQTYDATGMAVASRVIGDSPELGDDQGRHGTLVAGFLAGNGQLSEGYSIGRHTGGPFEWRGVAPGVDPIVSVVSVAHARPWEEAFITHRAYLSNNSHTQGAGGYTRISLWWDVMSYSGASASAGTSPPRVVVFSQGNNGAFHSHPTIPVRGYYGVTATGKNPIAVGGANANDDTHATGAALGPTLDGRLKPDVVAGGYVDWRPPDGALIALEEVRLVATEDGGAADIVWTPATTDPDWSLRGELEAATVVGSRLEYRTFGDAWLRYDPADPMDGTLYDRVRVRYEVLDAGDPDLHEAPGLLGTRWDTNGDGRFNRGSWPGHEPSVGMVELDEPLARFEGTPHAFEVSPTRWRNQSVVLNRRGNYGFSGGGTSFSSPIVTGVAALLLEQLRDDHGYDLDTSPPRPSTIKALLIHTATDLVRLEPPTRDAPNPDTGEAVVYHAGPDWATGYGLVNARAATDLVRTHRPDAQRFVEHAIEDGTAHVFTIRVRPDAGPLRATLAWDDFNGSTMIAPTERQLINDLDLVLVSPSGVAHGPWILERPPLNADPTVDGIDPIEPADIVPATRCAEDSFWEGASTLACENHLDNVEQAVVDAPEAGTWTVRVRARVIEGPQHYSLVVSQPCSDGS